MSRVKPEEMQGGWNRRDFMKVLAGSAISLAMGQGALAYAAEPPRKPNLLFIWTDEQRADTLAVYGNTKIRVPNLNQLASESIVFKSAYCTQPRCTPARSSVMTGLWPHTTGLLANNIPLPKDIPCLPELLADPDYRTGYMGKWHLGDEVFAQHGFQEWVSIEDKYAKYFRPDRDKKARSDYCKYLIGLGYKPDNKGKFDRNFAANLPIEHSKPKFLEGKACEFLRRHRDEPFILYVNTLEPHSPFHGPLDKEYDPALIELPASFDVPLGDNDPASYHKRRENDLVKWGKDAKTHQERTAHYWGLVTEVDRSFGGILKTLDELGLRDNTIVVHTSDHGDMMGAHHMVAKSIMYEEAVRIPWLMRVPWLAKSQQVIPGPVSHIDMMPTLLELLGSKAGKALPGQSLVPLIQGGTVAQDHVFCEWNSGVKNRTVIAPDGWKLSLFTGDKNQLFDLNNDPGEVKNLYYDGKHHEVIRRLSAKLDEWQKQAEDNLQVVSA